MNHMQTYNGYVILNPYTDLEFFTQYPNGDDMRLRLMCAGPEGSLFFFPEHYPITTRLEDLVGHPIAAYSPPLASVAAAMSAIDDWAPIDRRQQAERAAFFETPDLGTALATVEGCL